MNDLRVFALGATRELAQNVCAHWGIALSSLVEEKFPDGEQKVIPCDSIDGKEVIVFHSLGACNSRSVNDQLCELVFYLSTLRDLGAAALTAVIPYLAYARSDQRKGPFDSVVLRYVATMLEGSGVDRIYCLDVHNVSAFENAFRVPAFNLEAGPLFCQYLMQNSEINNSVVVLSPDIGGIKRAENFRRELEKIKGTLVQSAFLEKIRTSQGLTGHKLVGEVLSKTVIIFDDMISTGATILRALEAIREAGAKSVKVCATHGLFTKNPEALLTSVLVDELIVTDSHPAVKKITSYDKLKILSSSSVFANSINQY